MNVQLPENWEPVTPELATLLEAELKREITHGHEVAGMDLRAVAKRGRRDEVLFASTDWPERHVFVIHLTWSRETDPKWPSTAPYDNVRDFLERWPRDEFAEEADSPRA